MLLGFQFFAKWTYTAPILHTGTEPDQIYMRVYSFKKKTNTHNLLVPVIFFVIVVYARICFGWLAIQWPSLMAKWERVEQMLPPLSCQMAKSRLARKIKMITIVVMTLSLGKARRHAKQIY